jgi:hypothetical protein
MDHQACKRRFEELVAESGLALASLTPADGLELMIWFYRADAAKGSLECSWGNVSRYGDTQLGFEFTRQFDPDDPDSTLHDYLSLKFIIGPEDVAGNFYPDRLWARSGTGELAAFRATVEESTPFRAWGGKTAAGVSLICENLLDWAHPLHDCWGIRDPSRPIVNMTEEEWLWSDDAALMVRWLLQKWPGEAAELDKLLSRYFLACCRRIWRLLPVEDSRAGVEVAERFARGQASDKELGRAQWLAESAPWRFHLDPGMTACWSEQDHQDAARWCEEVARLSASELDAMICSPCPGDDLSPRGLLEHAGDFALYAICYPDVEPKESMTQYRLFLPAPLLREVVGNPFRTEEDRPRGEQGG